jgi:hypothetical protein
MHFRVVRFAVFILALFFYFLVAAPSWAQTATGSLRGQVTDPSGASVGGATVLVLTPGGAALNSTTNRDGIFEVQGLAPGKYGVRVLAQGFATFEAQSVEVAAGPATKLNVPLKIEEQEQKVEVTDSSTKVDVSPENNASTVVLKGKDLEALSDDPDELQSELQALAGPSAGPNGGQIYIDGFTAGQLPPKASIREIRINQNPFSAEYDRLGYGRVEIFTKPGTDQLHGQLFLTGNTNSFNSRNPFDASAAGTSPPGYETTQFSGSVGGPLSKKASFFFNFERRDINDLSVVNAQILDPNFNVTEFTQAVPNPRTRTNLSPRLDYQVSANNTLTVRYQYEHNNETNDGIGQFNLASLGYNELNTEQTLQISDTQILSPKVINETRFQFIRETTDQTPQSTAPTLSIQGAFVDGGNPSGKSSDILDRYELQNYTSMSLGKHFLKFGGRLRVNRDSNESNGNFNGEFNFGSRVTPAGTGCANAGTQLTGIQAFTLLQTGLANPPANVSPEQNLQMLIACGFGPSRYSITATPALNGSPLVDVNWLDAGLYVQDDWRVRPNITASFGLRFETQDHLSDHADFAPRVGIAWGIGGDAKKAPKVVLRGGFGIFYDRFTYDLVVQQERLNGLIQQQFVVNNPNFFLTDIPVVSQLQQTGTAASIYQVNPALRTPYIMQTGVSLERQLTKNANLAITYLSSRGIHQFDTNDINALNPANNGLRQNPAAGNIFQYQSEGIFKQNQLIVNSSIRLGAKLSLIGYYTLNYGRSDTNGAGSIPSNPFNLSEDYGRAAFDVRHRVFIGGTIGLPYSFRLSPYLIASSGIPFNITNGADPFGDLQFNARPSLASCTSAPSTNIVSTKFGCFNLTPAPGEPAIPINFAEGPGRFTLNLRLSKTFGFGKKTEKVPTGAPGGPGAGGTFGRGPGGPRGGGGGRGFGGFDGNTTGQRYSLTFGVAARNIFNNVNVATPIGDLSSPIFGQSNGPAGQPYSSSTANRRIDLQVTFAF